MKSIKYTAVALLAMICIVPVVIVAAALLVPPLLDTASIGSKVRREVSSLVGGEFDFDRVAVAVFPSPRLVLTKPRLSIQKQISVTAEGVDLYPDFIALMKGHPAVKQAVVRQPEATIWMPSSTGSPPQQHRKFDPGEILPSLLKALNRLPNLFRSIDQGRVSRGRIKFVYGQTQSAAIDDLEVSIQNESGSVEIKATAASELFEKLTLSGTFRPRQGGTSATLAISTLDLGAIGSIFLPDYSVSIDSGAADLDLSLTVQNRQQIDVDFRCSGPQVRLSRHGSRVDLETLSLAGAAKIGSTSTSITVASLKLGSPALQVSGSAQLSEGTPRVRVNLQGQDIEVSATRSAALALAGSDQVVQTIFEILQDGAVPSLTMEGQADTFSDLADLDNLVLQATLSKGTVAVPGTSLRFAEVSGDVGMKKGILTGEDVLAQWQHSTLKNGTFSIDLGTDPLPLNLQTGIEVDVVDIPTILETFVKDHSVNDALAQFEDLAGSATATVSLTGTDDQITVAASASDIKIVTRHHDLPSPLKITDGAISYDHNRIQVQQVAGSIGTSTFNSLSGTIGLEEAKAFTITSGASRIVLKDLLPWLSSYEAARKLTTHYGGGDGILEVTKFQGEGSLQDLRHAHFNLAGGLHDLTIQNLPRQPGPLTLAALTFDADSTAINVSGLQARMLDGDLTGSGSYHLHPKKDDQTRIMADLEGQLGSQLIGWVQHTAGLPPWVQLQPLSFRQAHVRYSNTGRHTISATLALQDDLEVLAELSLAADTVSVESLKVKDHRSQASATARKAGTRLDVSFDGVIHESTLNQVARLPSLQGGSLEGNAKASINPKNPLDFSLVGDLGVKQLSVVVAPEAPLLLSDVSLKGATEGITVKAADLSWLDTALAVSGTIKPMTGSLPGFSLDVAADHVDVDTIMKQVSSVGRNQNKKKDPAAILSSIEGDVRVKIGTLKVHDYTLQPFQADLHVHDTAAEVTLTDVNLCGIPVTGTAAVAPQNVSFHLEPAAHQQDLRATLDCLAGRQFKADGTLEFTGVFDGHGTIQELFQSIAGSMEITVSDGHIYHDIIMLNLLKFLNTIQVLTDQVTPDQMLQRGLGFDSFKAHAKIDKGRLRCEDFVLDGEEFKLGGNGYIDIQEKRLDMTLLLAPLKTSSTLLGHIPLIGGILQTIDTIPLGVKGSFEDLHFLPLEPSAVKDELQDVMKQTLGIPLKLIHLNEF